MTHPLLRLLPLCILLSSCSTREIAQVPFIALRPLEFNGKEELKVDTTRTVTGRHAHIRYDYISPNSSIYYSTMDAIGDEKSNCIGLANARIEWEGSPFAHLLRLPIPIHYTVTGNPVFKH